MFPLKIIFASLALFYSRTMYRWVVYAFTKDHYHLYGIDRDQRNKHFELEAIFEQEFIYFKSLSSAARKKFLARLWKVYNLVEFVGYSGLDVKENMKLRVLFSQIQLTFGLSTFYFKKFEKYILYPSTFYSRFFEKELKGLTSGTGFITLSWADFESGYKINDDKFNLGLHEMAHALRLDMFDNGDYGWRVGEHNSLFDYKAEMEMYMMHRDVPSVLREYAKTNKEEFFAVCVEYFFEAPELLNRALPDIYQTLCSMLNQNPLNHEMDYLV